MHSQTVWVGSEWAIEWKGGQHLLMAGIPHDEANIMLLREGDGFCDVVGGGDVHRELHVGADDALRSRR